MKRMILVLGLIVTFVAGCGVNTMTSIYDDNEKIAGEGDCYNLDETEQWIEEEKFAAEIERIEGTKTIWVYTANADEEIEISAFLKVDDGKAKLVLITEDGTVSIITEAEKDATASHTGSIMLKKGLNRIKLVTGKDTEMNINLSIPSGTFKKL